MWGLGQSPKNQWIMHNVQLIDLMIYRFIDEFQAVQGL
jgi:hypothetical protein